MKMVLITVIGSFVHALTATIISLVIGLPGAYCLARHKLFGSSLIIGFCAIACMMPTKLIASSIMLWFASSGSLSIIYAFCMVNIPFVVSVFAGVIEQSDRTLEELARDAGATWFQAIRTVVLPRIWPSCISIAGLIFVLCFSNISIPLILGSHPWHYTCDMMMYQAHIIGAYDTCAAYVVIRMLIKGLVLYYCTFAGLRTVPHSTHSVRTHRTALRHKKWWLLYWSGIGFIVSLPWLTLGTSIWRIIFNAHGMTVPFVPLYNSVYIACTSSLLTVMIGYFLVLITTQRTRAVITGVSMIPFLLGSVGCSIACIIGVRCGWYTPLIAATIGYGIVYYPYVYRILSTRMALYDPHWNEMARSYGASSWDIHKGITVPFLRSALLLSWCSVYVLGFSDVGISMVLAREGLMTVPALMREYSTQGNHDALWMLYGCTVISIIMFWLGLYVLWRVVDHFLIFSRRVVVCVLRQDVGSLLDYYLKRWSLIWGETLVNEDQQ